MSQMCQVHANLVGATGLQSDIQKLGCTPALPHPDPGHRTPPARNNGHATPFSGVSTDGSVHPQMGFGKMPPYRRKVQTAHLPFLQGQGEGSVCRLLLRDDEQS
jgi:hypothetical protein